MALAVLAMVATLVLPALGPLLRMRSLDTAAASLAGEIARIRQEAIARNRYVGIAFRRTPEADLYGVYLDGGRRGIRAAEIASGSDRLLRGPVDLTASHSGVRLGIPGPDPVPRVPPGRGFLTPGEDPVKFGSSDIISFSPVGESSSGSLYLTDSRGGVRSVVVYGRTGRIRVWRYLPEDHRWRQ